MFSWGRSSPSVWTEPPNTQLLAITPYVTWLHQEELDFIIFLTAFQVFLLHLSLLFARLEKPSFLAVSLGKKMGPGYPGSLPLDPPHFLHITADLRTP